MKNILLILVIIFSLIGCSRKPLVELPKSTEEYQLNKKELVQKYPEILTYENKWRIFFPNYPAEESIIKELGTPDKIEKDWWYPIVMIGTLVAIQAQPIVWGITLLTRPDIPKKYIYKKEDYCIKVFIDRTIFHGYRKYMQSWEWQEKNKDCLD